MSVNALTRRAIAAAKRHERRVQMKRLERARRLYGIAETEKKLKKLLDKHWNAEADES